MSRRESHFQATLEEMVSHLRPDRALVFYRAGSQELALQASHGLEGETSWTNAPLSLTLFQRVFTSGEPLLTTDALREPGLEEVSSLLIAGIRAVLCVPVWESQQVRGLLYADQRLQGVEFSSRDLVLLTNLARDLERRLAPASGAPARPANPAAAPVPPRPADPPRPPTRSLRLPERSRALLLRSLATMLGAGLPITRCLTLLADQGEDAPTRQVGQVLLAGVEAGQRLSVGMRQCGSAFSEFQLQLVAVAEQAGQLVEILRQLADHDEAQRALSLRLRSALTYPLFLFAVCTVLMVLVPPYMLRAQAQMLQSSGVQPPLLTVVLVRLTQAVTSPLGLLVGVLATLGALGAARAVRVNPPLRCWVYERLLGLPGLGKILRVAATARFARALALQLRAGLGVLQAIPSAARTTGNPVIVRSLEATVEALRTGSSVTQSLQAAQCFPRGLLLTLEAGEQAGHLPETLTWLANLCELELETQLEMACAALEPLLMLTMGVTAALVCLATMLPLIKLVQTL